jgi:hypothetical protein
LRSSRILGTCAKRRHIRGVGAGEGVNTRGYSDRILSMGIIRNLGTHL